MSGHTQGQIPSSITEGQVFAVTFPFLRDTFTGVGEDGFFEQPTWIPGVRAVDSHVNDCDYVADGEGIMTLTVVSIHRPGRYPTRVFYTRSFTTPDGKSFGKPKLRMIAAHAFRRLATRYRVDYTIVPQAQA